MRTRFSALGLTGVLVVGAVLGWGASADGQGGGTIIGEVKLSGTPPESKTIQINKDTTACGSEKTLHQARVGSGNGVADTLVSVPGVQGSPEGKAVLDQKECEFRPAVVVMAPGELEILNSDGVLHNIHTFSTVNPAINKAQPKFKKKMKQAFAKPEIIKVQCDAHAWMLGWIVVTDNPASVTDENGSFKITNVPAGTHKVEVWHPVLGKQEREVEVKAGQEAKVTFELAAK